MSEFNCIIVRYDEVGLKSKPVRTRFVDLITGQIKKINKSRILVSQSRIIVFNDKIIDTAKKLRFIFGISSISPAIMINKDIDLIKKTAYSLFKGGVFRITCQRISKDFSLKSNDVCIEVGNYIVNKGGKVNLRDYKENIQIEISKNKAFIFSEKFKGFGGLPVKSQGNVLCEINNQQDYLATLMMMNRGCYPLVTGDKKYFNLLKKNFSFLKLIFFEKISEVNKPYLAIVKGNSVKNIIKSNDVIFYPLIGLDINYVLEKFKELI